MVRSLTYGVILLRARTRQLVLMAVLNSWSNRSQGRDLASVET